MSDDEFTAMAETITGIVLYLTGVVSIIFGHSFTASLCFGSVAVLAVMRTWSRTKEMQITAEYYDE